MLYTRRTHDIRLQHYAPTTTVYRLAAIYLQFMRWLEFNTINTRRERLENQSSLFATFR